MSRAASRSEVDPSQARLGALRDELTALRQEIALQATGHQPALERLAPDFRASAQNLLHYLALRRRDLRSLQDRLAVHGLSSLGRAEAHVLATLDAVLSLLSRVTRRREEPEAKDGAGPDFAAGRSLLARHTKALFGPPPPGRDVRILVTMPTEAASDAGLIPELVRHGMDALRINCAHDDPATWLRMIEHLGRAESALGKSCRIVMDLPGPKLRTGPLEPGPAVLRLRPRRDELGRVTAPARIWLTTPDARNLASTEAGAVLCVRSEDWLARLRSGEKLRCRDTRGARRVFRVEEVSRRGCWVHTDKTVYVADGTVLRRRRRTAKHHDRGATVTGVPHTEGGLLLREGDQLCLTRNQAPGRPSLRIDDQIVSPPTIGCTLPEVYNDVQPGESIYFDDGKIGGRIEEVLPDRVLVRITRALPGGSKLRADQGINLPESHLRLGALTEYDRQVLPFIAEHADIVCLSFANCARDVELLQELLALRGASTPGLVLKIETRRGFSNLPEMLLAAMRWPACGVMIARGDLAVECGFERLAEVQEEILWVCEAAHVPVIWATQVLESLAKHGLPSRAEITDAAMGHRAECVMLNKGPHVVAAVHALDDILRRMQDHQVKKTSMLRELHLAHLPAPAPPVARESSQH